MNPIPLIIDTDMAMDDWMAILYLMQSVDVDLRAITIAATGEAHAGPGMRNALGLAGAGGSAVLRWLPGALAPARQECLSLAGALHDGSAPIPAFTACPRNSRSPIRRSRCWRMRLDAPLVR